MFSRTSCLVALALTIALPAVAQDDSAAPSKPETPEDRVSYSIGLNIGSGIKRDGIAVNFDLLLQGINDGASGADPLMTMAEMQSTMQEFQQAQRAKQAGRGAENKAAGDAFLASNKEREGVQVTESGLQYEVIVEGDGAKPSATDKVNVHYTGTLLDGTKFDSSYNRGTEPTNFPVNAVIPGWTEGLQLMSVGSIYTFYIPSGLAYGPSGNRSIPPNSTLTFEVELVSIDGQ